MSRCIVQWIQINNQKEKIKKLEKIEKEYNKIAGKWSQLGFLLCDCPFQDDTGDINIVIAKKQDDILYKVWEEV